MFPNFGWRGLFGFSYRVLLILTCTGVSFVHRSNDGQKELKTAVAPALAALTADIAQAVILPMLSRDMRAG